MYNIIMDTLRFEWDPNKNEINKKKHGLSFEAAKEVFYDEFAILFDDPDHSIEEDRFLIIGSIKSQKICIVSHCYRDNENCIRIISARPVSYTHLDVYKRQLHILPKLRLRNIAFIGVNCHTHQKEIPVSAPD